jgi:carboxypeptidase Taq
MHWAVGGFGYFPTYTLGTLYAAALFDRAREDMPGLCDDLRAGNTAPLLAWLREKVHHVGSRKPGKEIAEQAIGGPLKSEPFLDHLKTKYGDLFGVEF